jgi:hypothetical protein
VKRCDTEQEAELVGLEKESEFFLSMIVFKIKKTWVKQVKERKDILQE